MFILWKSRNQLNKSICTVFYFFTLVFISRYVHIILVPEYTPVFRHIELTTKYCPSPRQLILGCLSSQSRAAWIALKGRKKTSILCHHRKISSYRNKHVWLIIFWHGIIYLTLLFSCFFSQWTMKLCLLLTPTNIHKFLWKVNKGID